MVTCWFKNDVVCALLHNSADSPLSNFVEDSCGSRIWLLEQGLRQPVNGILSCSPLCCPLHSSNEFTTSFALGRQQRTEGSGSVKHFVGCWLAIAPLHVQVFFPVALIALVRKAYVHAYSDHLTKERLVQFWIRFFQTV